jgi:hypothetical protein
MSGHHDQESVDLDVEEHTVIMNGFDHQGEDDEDDEDIEADHRDT